MRVLITGSSGYLGQHFLSTLFQRPESNDICVLYRSMEGFEDAVRSHPNASNSASNIYFSRLDLTKEMAVDNFFNDKEPFDICFHLAAIASPKICQQDPSTAKAVNVPVHFLNKLKETPIIALSTDQVYCGTKAPYTEDSTVGPVNIYSQTKVDLEDFLMACDSHSKYKAAVCLRSSIILGGESPFGKSHLTFLHFCKSREGKETTFYSDECRSVISVRDVCHTLSYFLTALQKGKEIKTDVYNMGGPVRVSRLEMAIEVANHYCFDSSLFLSAEKTSTPGEIPSPLDISMDSRRLEDLVGIKFRGLEATVKATFA